MAPDPEDHIPDSPQKLASRARLLAFAASIIGLYLLASNMGWLEQLNIDNIRGLISKAGIWSVFAFFILFSIGQLLHVPGIIFVAAAALAFGKYPGLIIAMTGAVVAISFAFFLVRYVGGTPLANPNSRWVKNAVLRLDSNPFKTVLVLRFLFSTGPWLNYVLAMSSVSYSRYISASILGIFPHVALTIYFVEKLTM